ncbi:ntrilase and fragile histidine triad fusion protein NitFhit [Andrena cerasifolii]|uniref:ntrilase and fragile histidine triad fusion protein NitFhit n=1 Tax=Andrena cerasifolii TaxID=2819439 RepID=UPI0040379820
MISMRFIIGFASAKCCRGQFRRPFSAMANPLIAVCQMTSTNDKEKNLQTVSELAAKAKSRSACIAFLPEACDYLADNKKDTIAMAQPLNGPIVASYKEIARANTIWLSLGGLHEAVPDNKQCIHNTHILINSEGEIVSTYRKAHLYDMDNKSTGVRLMESDYVIPGESIEPPVSTPVGKLALSICYDVRFPELSLALRNMGAEILTYPSAFVYQTGAAHWEVLLRARAIETQCYVVAAAQTGTHNKKRVSWGHAMIIDPWGTVIAQCSDKTDVAVAEIHLDLLQQIRENMPCENHRRTDLYPEMKSLKSST